MQGDIIYEGFDRDLERILFNIGEDVCADGVGSLDNSKEARYDAAYEYYYDDLIAYLHRCDGRCTGRFLVFIDLGLWDGHRNIAAIDRHDSLGDVVRYFLNDLELDVIEERNGDAYIVADHHDGTNTCIVRRLKDTVEDTDFDSAFGQWMRSFDIDRESWDKHKDEFSESVLQFMID